jgi:putative DNA primase/helicase
MSTDMCAAALDYANRGWEVFPAKSDGSKKSEKSAKFSNGHRWGKTTDLDEIRHDWRKWPDANVGIATGPQTGFFVVEADTKKGHNVDGVATLRALEAERGALPETLMAESPTGSLHYYFRWPRPVP